jgi:hypothetical protein
LKTRGFIKSFKLVLLQLPISDTKTINELKNK